MIDREFKLYHWGDNSFFSYDTSWDTNFE